MRALAVALLVTTACTEHGQTPPFDAKPKPRDAPVVVVDAQSGFVVPIVPCPNTVAATVMTVDGTLAFMPPSTMVMQGGIVKFVMSASHDVAPAATMSDPGLSVDFGATKCLQFNQPGMFTFQCIAHGESGTVTVFVVD